MARYGDCNPVSDKVVSELKKTWPKIRAVGSDYDSRWGYIKHTSVEIPELNLAIDPTHDQMHKYPKKKIGTLETQFELFEDYFLIMLSRFSQWIRQIIGINTKTPNRILHKDI